MQKSKATDWKPTHFGWQVQDQVATVTLNRPERKNPLTFESYAELRDTFHALKYVDDVRVVVVRGAGGNFCSGGDVHEIIGPLTRMDMPDLLAFTTMTGELVKEMRACPQPVIAAVDGVCAGAGAIVAMASDLRYGTASTKTAFLFSRVGLAGCDMGACAMLPRIIGQGRASELLYMGRSMRADEGLAWGWFNALVPSDQLGDTAHQTALSLAHGPTFAHAMTKRCLHMEWNQTIEQALDTEALAQSVCMQTGDFRRAYEAFVAKETPRFKGN